MNKNVLIVLAGGFLIAVLVAVIVNASLSGTKQVADEGPKVEILVAATDLSIGKEIEPSDVKWQEWPESSVFSTAIRREGEQDAAEVVKGRLNISLSSGQPILSSYLVSESSTNFMAATIGQGMRAIGIAVKAETMAGGFIGPGDYVDVLLTYKVRIKDRDNAVIAQTVNQLATETLLERVRVLAVDQTSTREEDKAKVARTVTLEVDAVGAEKLSLASELGDLTLALRSLGDEELVADKNSTTDVKMTRVLKNVTRLENSSGGSSGIVRVYNGQEIQNVPVRQSLELEE